MKMAFLFTAAAAAAAAHPQRFDLNCREGSTAPTHYRVDLGAHRWCWDACKFTSPIAKVEARRITFKSEDTPSNNVWNWVDRTTGEWFQGITSAEVNVSQHGTCETAPFSGFPTVRTKF
jgi:hypothetical protein